VERLGDVERPAAQAPAPEPEPVPSSPAPVQATAMPPVKPSVSLMTPAAPVALPEDYVLPMDSLVAVAESAGLQWVNSDAGRIQAVQEAMAQTPPPAHRPREIRAVEVVAEGPLVLVETKKDLSQVRLPFETMGRDPSTPA